MAIRFGVALSTSAAPGAHPLVDARHAEDLGYDFLTVSDHPQGTHATYETWTLLTWAAAATSRIGLFTNVLGLPYRHPPLVAKMAETLDRLSGGRLILGLGAGGVDDVFRSFGLPVRSNPEKIEALQEAIEIIRALWRDQTLTFTGRHFQTDGAFIEPKAERPIPIVLGTYGSRGLRLAGRRADGISISAFRVDLETGRSMCAQVVEAARSAGRDSTGLILNYNVGVMLDEKARGKANAIVGTADAVVEQLTALFRAGFTSIAISALGNEDEQRTRIATEVLPHVRGALG